MLATPRLLDCYKKMRNVPIIRNVVFDAGGVLLEWNPPRIIAELYPDPAVQAQIRERIFEHPDWHEFDRGTISEATAPGHFAKLSGRSHRRGDAHCCAPRPNRCAPSTAPSRLLEDLAAGGVHLFLLSNMPESTFNILVKRHAFFAHFKHLVISGKDPAAQARARDLQAPGGDHRHRAGRERVHR